MRSLLAITLGLSLSTIAFAQDNASNAAVSQQDLNSVFHAGTTITQQNLLSKQEKSETTGGVACLIVTIISPDGTVLNFCL